MTTLGATAAISLPSDTEIVLTRTVAAPRELVWTAWTDPRQLARWWGPVGFTTSTRSMNVREGGQWRFTMHGPDGTNYENLVTYLEVAEPERLVYRHGDSDPHSAVEPVRFTVTVTFTPAGPAGELTGVKLSMVFPSKEHRDFVIKEYGAVEGGKQTLARLGEHLESLQRPPSTDDGAFVISRVFRAPRELVWRAWTEHDLLARWFGPKGTTIARSTLDLRPGGRFHYGMRSDDDASEHWGLWTIREVAPPDRLTFVVCFADGAGKPVRAFSDPTWPMETLSTVTFADHAGKGAGTVVHVRWEPINASEEECRVFAAGHPSMNQGWSGTLERLAEFLWDRC